MKAPPLLPEEAFDRTVRVAHVDGLCVLVVAGMLALAAASAGDYRGAAIGLLVAAAGAIELHGVGLLRAGEGRGMNWLIASQPYLFVVLLAYCTWRLASPEVEAIRAALTDEMRATIAAAGRDEEEFVRFAYTLTYTLLAAGTLLYQGAMTLYYVRRRAAVVAAVGESELDDNESDEA